MKNLLKLLVVSSFVIAAAMSYAQQGGGGGGGRGGRGMFGQGMMGGGGIGQLRRKDVQEDLKLTEDQKTKLAEVQKKMQEEMRQARENAQASGGGDPEAMRAAMTKMFEDYRKEVNAI